MTEKNTNYDSPWKEIIEDYFPQFLEFFFYEAYVEIAENPFGLVVMAHLKTKATSQNPESRLQWKLRLVRSLFTRGYSREQIIGLFRFIDWIMFLPQELANSFQVELRNDGEVNRMRYVTSIERLAKEEGVIENARESVVENLLTRFEEVPTQVVEAINKIDDVTVLKSLLRRAILVSSIAEFEQDLGSC
ncbi:MAG: hypothetical protein IGS23_04685 [Rivularia sp. T60_A2020_040]|nr:hypothetical protein [Rivularia sp. T60_A2020_040]